MIDKVYSVVVTDLKHDFDFTIAVSDLNDLLDVAERFPRHIYEFHEMEVIRREEISLSK